MLQSKRLFRFIHYLRQNICGFAYILFMRMYEILERISGSLTVETDVGIIDRLYFSETFLQFSEINLTRSII